MHVAVPDKVYHINEIDAEEAKKMTMNMTMDSSDDDRWWEQVDLTRLYLSSNQLSSLSPEISNLSALQILDVSGVVVCSGVGAMFGIFCLVGW